MYATQRRYEGIDQSRIDELSRKVNESLIPKLSKLPGFEGYYLIEAGNGVFSSLGLFETPEQGKESTKIVASWIRDEKLDTARKQRRPAAAGLLFVLWSGGGARRGRAPSSRARSPFER